MGKIKSADLPLLPHGIVDAVAGYGDGVSFGLTQWIRIKCGTDAVVNSESEAYNVARVAGSVMRSSIGRPVSR